MLIVMIVAMVAIMQTPPFNHADPDCLSKPESRLYSKVDAQPRYEVIKDILKAYYG